LPELLEGQHLLSIVCRSSPNPAEDGGVHKYTPATKPYINDPSCAIILFNMTITDRPGTVRHTFNMIVHRKALLDLVPEEKLRNISEMADKLRSVRDGVESTTDSDLAAQLSSVSLDDMEIEKVPWANWGPPITRWFDTNSGVSRMFVASTAGQRYVQYTVPEAKEGTEPTSNKPNTIHLLDFNPSTIKRAWNGLGRPGPFRGPSCTVTIVGMAPAKDGEQEAADNVLPGGKVFAYDIVGRLPYVRCMSHEEWTFNGVMMSEEMLLGMKLEPGTYHMKSMGVVHFG